MPKVKVGRPKGKGVLSKESILKEALYLLDENGPQGLSMRSLASRLKVTPMALYNHFPDRSTLLRCVSDMVYSEVTKNYESFSGDLRERFVFLLVTYHEAVIHHPNLSISIFENPDAFSHEVQKITNHILELLSEAKVAISKRDMWLDILVDFTHGNSLAIALNQINESKRKNLKNESIEYKKELNLLLDVII